MKVLVDSNIFIDFWKQPTEMEKRIFENGNVDIASCGCVRTELLRGAYSRKNLNSIRQMLNMLPEYNITDEDWDKLGELMYNLRINGVTVPYADAVIAYTSIKYDLAVWTRDKHFNLIKVVDPELKLFDAEEFLTTDNND